MIFIYYVRYAIYNHSLIRNDNWQAYFDQQHIQRMPSSGNLICDTGLEEHTLERPCYQTAKGAPCSYAYRTLSLLAGMIILLMVFVGMKFFNEVTNYDTVHKTANVRPPGHAGSFTSRFGGCKP